MQRLSRKKSNIAISRSLCPKCCKGALCMRVASLCLQIETASTQSKLPPPLESRSPHLQRNYWRDPLALIKNLCEKWQSIINECCCQQANIMHCQQKWTQLIVIYRRAKIWVFIINWLDMCKQTHTFGCEIKLLWITDNINSTKPLIKHF